MTRQVAAIMRSIRKHLLIWFADGSERADVDKRTNASSIEKYNAYRRANNLIPFCEDEWKNVPPPRHLSLWLPVGKTCTMNKQEPPSTSNLSHPLLLVGQNSSGQWVVRNQCGSRGGLFVDCTHAIKFAMLESGRRPQDVIMVPGVLELDMSSRPNAVVRLASKVVGIELQRAA